MSAINIFNQKEKSDKKNNKKTHELNVIDYKAHAEKRNSEKITQATLLRASMLKW